MHHCKRISKHAAKAANVEMNQHVFALDLFHVWAQLAPYVSFESLIVLGMPSSLLRANSQYWPRIVMLLQSIRIW